MKNFEEQKQPLNFFKTIFVVFHFVFDNEKIAVRCMLFQL
jgi:hypothetical protein